MKKLKITIRNLQKKIPVNPAKIKGLVSFIFSRERASKTGEITVCFMGDREIRELNLLYLGRYEPTDVIAFDLSGGKKEISADIAVSADTAIRNAKIYRTSKLYELNLYVTHGILHFLGYDDKTAKQRKAMEIKAAQILLSVCPSIKPKQ
jgi:rRNA maturation RNase YbeY